MTYKEVFLTLMEHNLPQEITITELPDRITVAYNGVPFIVEVNNDNDSWARLTRHILLSGINHYWANHKNIDNIPITPTDQIRANYKPKDAPDETTGAPNITRPVSKDKL